MFNGSENNKKNIMTLSLTAWRVVEAQNKSSTRKLVDSLAEHEILEEMIEEVKPKLSEIYKTYHYLLSTPFRYPPLKHGSRFGTKHERSIWYGSRDVRTCLCEKAYYSFKFISHSTAKIMPIPCHYTVFSVEIYSEKGIDFTSPSLSRFRDKISNPKDHVFSQKLGKDMREEEVEVFLYFSARDKQDGVNVGLFSPKAFKNKRPNSGEQTWLSYMTESSIDFVRQTITGEDIKYNFRSTDF